MSTDFDFLVGTFDVVNRRLLQRHVGCVEWDEFPAVSRTVRFFGGAGNFDEIDFVTKGSAGATLRLYEPAADEWTLNWINGHDGLLTPPMRGRFVDGIGTFFGDDVDNGIPIKCRFVWSDITESRAVWEQGFSVDDGTTWESNWTMHFTRRPPV